MFVEVKSLARYPAPKYEFKSGLSNKNVSTSEKNEETLDDSKMRMNLENEISQQSVPTSMTPVGMTTTEVI